MEILRKITNFLKPDMYDISLVAGAETGLIFPGYDFIPLPEIIALIPIIYLAERVGRNGYEYLSKRKKEKELEESLLI